MKNRISELRTDKGMATVDLSAVLNVNIRTIQRYENGEINPPPDKLKIMAEIFNCSIDYILYLTDYKSPEQQEKAIPTEISKINVNPATKKIFVERLKDSLVRKEMTKEALSKSVKVSKDLINNYIDGISFPDVDILKKIAKRLSTTIDYLVGLNDTSIPNYTPIFIAGEYVTRFEDETNGKKIITSAPAVLNQQGKNIQGYTYLLDNNRKWIIEGEISSNGYFYGIYYAEDFLDKGIGNFFLSINANKTMNGIWSGYDSVNKKITFGTYELKPAYTDFKLVDLKSEHIPQILDISDVGLGKDYLSYQDIQKVIINSEKFICKVAINNSDDKVIGFGLGIIANPENITSFISWTSNKLPRALKHSRKIGIIKTIAVSKENQGYGIGKKITEECYNGLIDKGVHSFCSIAWKNGNVVNIGGILSSIGFKEYTAIENYWKSDSSEKGYYCPSCGSPPCTCTGVIYVKF